MYYFLLIVQYLGIILLMIEAGFIYIRLRSRVQGFLFFNVMATLINNAGYLMEMTATTKEAYLVGLKMAYLGKVWIGFSLLLLVMGICKWRIPHKTMIALAIFSAITFLLVFTCEYNGLYYTTMDYITTGLFPSIKCGHGFWHDLYDISLLSYIGVGIYALIREILKENSKILKKRLLILLIAIITESVFYLSEILINPGGYDDCELGYTISSMIMIYAIFRYQLLDTLQVAKDYVIDEVSEGIVVVGVNGTIEYYNKPAKQIFPVIENYQSRILEEIRTAMSNKVPLEVDGRIYTPEVRALEKNGVSAGCVYVLVDDTEHYKYLNEVMEQKRIAEEANASKSVFLSIVSHEIRTPMNAVVGMTDLLLREKDNLSDKQEKYLNNIKNSGASLVMIVNDILDQSKIEAGKMEIIDELYEIRPMLEDVRMIIENRIGSKPVKLIMDVDDNIPKSLVGDSLRIRQILINLMNNAVKFTAEGYIQLSISCEKTKEDKLLIRFLIKDSGQGIKQEDLSKLGKAFTQVDMKKNHGKEGTGLGLSISRDFISMMGGQLEVASEYGKGSEFFFSIWQGIDEISNDDGNSCKQAWKGVEEFTSSKAKVLLVDDNEINLMIAEELLEPLEMKVDLASSGEEALEKVKDNKYDMIFMDYMMPYMDGITTTENIRRLSVSYKEEGNYEMSKYLNEVPIIALSGDTSSETRERFQKAGMVDFTEKPVELLNLKKILLKWLPEHLIEFKKG